MSFFKHINVINEVSVECKTLHDLNATVPTS